MSIKLTALVTAALFATAGAASAYADAFTFQPFYDDSSIVELDTVTASGAGVVEIYNYGGDLLGSTPVRAGANSNVRVNINIRPTGDLQAVLLVDGQVTAQERLNVR